MATLVRRINGPLIEVIFANPIEAASATGQKLVEFSSQPDVHLLAQGDVFTGVQCPDKAYLRFLESVNASKETVTAIRRALDDSKKATRERMRR